MKQRILIGIVFFFLLGLLLVHGQDYAVLNNPSQITTSCITNGTLNASGATIAVYAMNGTVLLPTTQEYNITTGIFGVNITFPSVGKYVSVEACNFSGVIVQGSEWIVIEENTTLRTTGIINNQLFSMSAVENDTNLIVRQINSSVNSNLGNLTAIQVTLGQINVTTNTINTLVTLMNTSITNSLANITTGQNNLSNQLLSLQNLLNSLSQGQNQSLLGIQQINTTVNGINISLLSLNMTLNSITTSIVSLNNAVYFLQNQTQNTLMSMNVTLQENNNFLKIINATTNRTLVVVDGLNFNTTTLLSYLQSISGVTNQTNITANQILTIVGIISNVTDQTLQVSLDLQKNITFIRSTLQNITVSIANVQSSITSVGIDVNDLQNSMLQVKNNLTLIEFLEQNETQAIVNFSNITNQLNSIQASINANTLTLVQVNTTSNTILSDLLLHMSTDNQTETIELSYLQNITINLSQIQSTLNNIQLNISSQNLTDLNNSLSGLIISQTNQATSLSLTSFLLIIMAILFLLMLFLDKPLLYILAGLYTFVVSFVVMTDLGTTFSLVLTFLGICCIIIGAIKVE